MVASPETCRRNGSKSKGPKTSRGKAIASRNATKHGLLAQQPPLLITEDLEAFDKIINDLTDYYDPQSPVEHFFIKKVAMGMLRQNRLWNAEAASSNLAILNLKKRQQFPDYVIPGPTNHLVDKYLDTVIPFQTHVASERSYLLKLLESSECDREQLPQHKGKTPLKVLSSTQSDGQWSQEIAPYKYLDKLAKWFKCLQQLTPKKRLAALPEAIARVEHLTELLNQRLEEINNQLAAAQQNEADIQQATRALDGIKKPELFSRYQQAINRDLYAAIDRLEKLREE